MAHAADAYLIVLTDGDSDVYTYSLPNTRALPYRVYATLSAAETALQAYTRTLEGYQAVAYGQAFPYEHTSFAQELAQKKFAAVGWFRYQDIHTGESIKIKIGILRISSDSQPVA